MLLDSALQDFPYVGSVEGTEDKSSQPIESSKKKNHLCKVKVTTGSLRSGCMSPAIHIMIQKAIILYFFRCLFAACSFGTDGGNWE